MSPWPQRARARRQAPGRGQSARSAGLPMDETRVVFTPPAAILQGLRWPLPPKLLVWWQSRFGPLLAATCYGRVQGDVRARGLREARDALEPRQGGESDASTDDSRRARDRRPRGRGSHESRRGEREYRDQFTSSAASRGRAWHSRDVCAERGGQLLLLQRPVLRLLQWRL